MTCYQEVQVLLPVCPKKRLMYSVGIGPPEETVPYTDHTPKNANAPAVAVFIPTLCDFLVAITATERPSWRARILPQLDDACLPLSTCLRYLPAKHRSSATDRTAAWRCPCSFGGVASRACLVYGEGTAITGIEWREPAPDDFAELKRGLTFCGRGPFLRIHP